MIFLLAGYSSTESVFKLIGLILLCVVIILASYYVTKFVGSKQSGMSTAGNFKSIDVYRLSQNKYIQIVRIGTRYFAIAVSKDNISVIAELGEDEITVSQPVKAASFKSILEGLSHKQGETPEASEESDDGKL